MAKKGFRRGFDPKKASQKLKQNDRRYAKDQKKILEFMADLRDAGCTCLRKDDLRPCPIPGHLKLVRPGPDKLFK